MLLRIEFIFVHELLAYQSESISKLVLVSKVNKFLLFFFLSGIRLRNFITCFVSYSQDLNDLCYLTAQVSFPDHT